MRRHFLTTFAIPALFLVLSTACNEEADTTGPLVASQPEAPQANLGAIPTEPILTIVNTLIAAWTVKDAAAYAAPYAADLQFINPLGALISGRDAFRAQHVFLFSGPFAGSTLSLVVRDIQFLTGTIAIVYLDTSLTGYAFLPPGLPSSGGVQRNRATWVVEKRGGEWQIVFQQYTPQL